MNYKASVDVSFEHNSTEGGDNYAAIGVRQQGGENSHYMGGTPYFLKFWFDGGWSLHVSGSSIASGNVVNGSGGVRISGFNTSYTAWHNISLKVVENKITAILDGVTLYEYTDPNPRLSGRVDLASGYYNTRFDNLKVETIEGYSPYYSEILDNLEMYDLSSVQAPGLYSAVRGRMKTANRCTTTSAHFLPAKGGCFASIHIQGTGWIFLVLMTVRRSWRYGGRKGGKYLAGTKASEVFIKLLHFVRWIIGEHTVGIKVLSGTLVVDEVAVVSDLWKFNPDPTPTPTPTVTISPTLTPTPAKSIDVNNDGAVNMTDVMIVARAFNSVRGGSRYVRLTTSTMMVQLTMTDIMIIAAKFNTVVARIA
jgi:hypothetical protein